jgi:hypothetical protein
MTNEKTPNSVHLEWVIKGRAKNQQVALDLYDLMTENHNTKVKLHLSERAQDLTAIAFSLWRAAFLADRTGETEAKMKHAEEFLAKMLTDNAIAFAQDRSAREWTFNYYLDNAGYRLAELGYRNLRPPSGKRTPRNRWDRLHQTFEEAVSDFAKALTTKKTSK